MQFQFRCYWNPKFSEGDGGEADEAAGASSPIETPQRSDAELIAMCEEYMALDLRYLALADAHADLSFDDPVALKIDEEIDSFTPRFRELQGELADGEAVTLAGALALARAARHQLSGDARKGAVDLAPEGELAWAAIESLLALLNDGKAVA